MKVNYVKTKGFRKFRDIFETDLYDTTKITGKNRSGKSNLLYAITNIMLGTNLSGDEKACLINNRCDSSYGELHFTDNNGMKHILSRGKNKYSNKGNFIALDGKPVNQTELTSFYKDKKLFLSIINPLYFLSKKPAEQKEMVDKYLSDIKPKVIFDRLDKPKQEMLLRKYFKISLAEIYSKLDNSELRNIYYEYKINEKTGTEFERLLSEAITDCLSNVILTDIKYYYMLDSEKQEEFINCNMFNICLDIAYNNLSKKEQNILEGVPRDIPSFITELNSDIKRNESIISSLDGKIEYALKFANEKLSDYKVFDKDEELSLAEQELSYLNTNEKIVDKENQKKVVESLEKDILSKETEFNELEKNMKSGKQKYLSIKNGESCTCPTCNQNIQDESKSITIKNMHAELISMFDRRNLLETQLKDLKFNLSVERCKYHAVEGNPTVEKQKRIDVVTNSIKQLEQEKLDIQKFNNEIAIKEKNINEAKSDIEKFNCEKQQKLKLIEDIKQTKKIAQKLYISYIEEKMKLATEYLKDVNIKFYSVLKTTGEIKEDFIITYKNNQLSDLSKSETIATSLELANMFNKISKANFPIFIDDYESCADYDFIKEYSNDTQLIISKVEKGHPLKIADNNSDKFTIIKPTISGFKSMNIQNKNNSKIATEFKQAA